MQYLLMCKDDIRAEFSLEKDIDVTISNVHVLGQLPVSCTKDTLLTWLNGRNASKHRKHLREILVSMDCADTIGFLKLTHGISINDCFWVKNQSESLTWQDISPYTNDYDEIIQHLAFDGHGLGGVQLSPTSPEFGTSGAFDKCWVREQSGIYLIKRGSDIASNSGLEPYCEVLASQVFSKLKAGIPYKLIHYRGKIASKCKLFNDETMSYVPSIIKYGVLSSVRDVLNTYDSIPNGETLRRILIADALTLNTDRHSGNYGVLLNSMNQSLLSMAPGYDYNLSMLPYAVRDDFSDVTTQIQKQFPKVGDSFLSVARGVLTSNIRKDLINLKGIELSLPFYDDKYTEERVKWMTEIVNTQITNVLNPSTTIYPTIKVDGLSNCMKYRLKFHLSEDDWIEKVPYLMKLLGISHMDELEREIVVFL